MTINSKSILIDFTQIPIQKTGIGVYGLNLISEIHKLDNNNCYYILVQDDDSSLNFINKSNFEIIRVSSKFFRNIYARLILEQLFIPYMIIKYRINIIHALHYSFPVLVFAKRIVTIPDMTFLKYPRCHAFTKKHYFGLFIYLSHILADKIITISKSSRSDYLQKFKCDENKVYVTYLGVKGTFNSQTENNQNKIKEIKNKYAINKDYILFMGTLEPRKNIKNLILAFSKLIKNIPSYKLVIAGKKGWDFNETFKLVDKLSLGQYIIFTDFVSEEDKPFLIAGSKIFVYPSLYEGFGLPVLEAMSCGKPTITSNSSSLPEIAGDAALLTDPLNTDKLYNDIKRLLEDNGLYNNLINKSIEQSRKFSWEKTAKETINVYNSFYKS